MSKQHSNQRRSLGKGTVMLLTAILAAASWQSGCMGLLDGTGLATADRNEGKGDTEVTDDRIEDKHPEYVQGRTVEEQFGSCVVTLNKSGSVTKLDIVNFGDEDDDLDGRIFHTKKDAIAGVHTNPDRDIQASLETINSAVKSINDGLYAALEIRLQEGIEGTLPGKRQFLVDLAKALAEAAQQAEGAEKTALEQGLAHVAAGLMAGGNDPAGLGITLDAGTKSQAQAELDKFDGVPLLSKPGGFYTWNETLEEVFRQDRFFHNSLADGMGSSSVVARYAAIAAILNERSDLLEAYQTYLAAMSGLDTKFAAYPVTALLPYVPSRATLANLDAAIDTFLDENPQPYPCKGPYLALFPASLSKDTEFVSSNYCMQPPPAGTTVFDIIVGAIRSGSLDLTPDENSGWYDYQLYALETLLVPEKGMERDHLFLTAKYKKKLIESFKTMITQIRETHYKGLDIGGIGAAAEPVEVTVYPKLPIEPFPTYYLRTARAYRFLDATLVTLLGEQALSDIHRLGPEGETTDATVLGSLHDVTKLMYGLYVVSAKSLGLDPAEHMLEGEADVYPLAECEQRARQWIESWTQDPNVLADGRVVVPVAYDATTDEYIYWAVVGVKVLLSQAEFYEGYEPEVVETNTEEGPECIFKGFESHSYYLLAEPTVEFRLPAGASPLTRDELRAICDEHDSIEDIEAALEATR